MSKMIIPPRPLYTTPGKHTARVEEKTYLRWIRQLPCAVSGKTGVDAAHVSFASRDFGAPGRGKGRKVSDRWVLPLSREMHDLQGSNKGTDEKGFWTERGINPHLLCLILWGLWSERGDDCTDEAIRLVRNARKVAGI